MRYRPWRVFVSAYLVCFAVVLTLNASSIPPVALVAICVLIAIGVAATGIEVE